MKRFTRVAMMASVGMMLNLTAGCTQETQNTIGRAIQNWTGTDGVLDIYASDKLVMRFQRFFHALYFLRKSAMSRPCLI